MKYISVLGKNHDLSVAELGSFFGEKIEGGTLPGIAFFEGNLPDEPQKFLNRLGGTLQIIEIVETGLPIAEVSIKIENFLKEKWRGKTGKLKFGISLFPHYKKSQFLKRLIVETKKNLRQQGLHVSFMNKNFQNVSDVFAVKSGLLKEGTNISIIEEGEGRCSLGFSVAIQDFEGYAARDFGKPFRDPQAGMIPPKLAQMMINLGAFQKHSRENRDVMIFDPFCGTGTIVMEAILMGYEVKGSDENPIMTKGAQQNIDWLIPQFTALPPSASCSIFTKNATALERGDFNHRDGFAVVTEPHLGPPLSRFPHEKFLEKVMDELTTLYSNFFKNLSSFIPKGSPVVFIFPYWRKSKTTRILLSSRLTEHLAKLGFQKTVFVPLKATSLFYERPDQIVGREIIRLIKV